MARFPTTDLILRPFEGLPSEPDWVAMREVVPSATASASTTAEYGARDLTVVTTLPEGWAAVHREDGMILLALQSPLASDDLSRDLAATLIRALATEPGTTLPGVQAPGPGPRLQDVLNLTAAFEVVIDPDLSFWLESGLEVTPEVAKTVEDAAKSLVPTVKVEAAAGAYWCQLTRPFLRWARPEPEDDLIDAIARLHATRESGLAGGRFVGAFRSCGLLIPVWELPDGVTADDVAAPLADLGQRLDQALAIREPLGANERRARAGIVSRQVTLR